MPISSIAAATQTSLGSPKRSLHVLAGCTAGASVSVPVAGLAYAAVGALALVLLTPVGWMVSLLV
jgi:hypothetical protein